MGKWLIKIGNAIVAFSNKLKTLWNKMLFSLMFANINCEWCQCESCTCKKEA